MPNEPAPARAALEQRYRTNPPEAIAWNETLDVLLSHHSTRAFLPDALPKDTLQTLVAAAQSAPTSSNLQAWSVIAVQDPERKARLAALAGGQRHIIVAPLFLVWLVDLNRLSKVAEVGGTSGEALDYLECFLLGVIDAALAAQNAMAALQSLGLGAVYIGAMRNKPLEVAAELGLPPRVFAAFGMAIGRPDPNRPASVKPRLAQEAVLFHEQYSFGKAQLSAIAAYNEVMREFQIEQRMPEQDWSVQIARRLRGPESLDGRDVLRKALHQLGFELL
jgi:nitroreductase